MYLRLSTRSSTADVDMDGTASDGLLVRDRALLLDHTTGGALVASSSEMEENNLTTMVTKPLRFRLFQRCYRNRQAVERGHGSDAYGIQTTKRIL